MKRVVGQNLRVLRMVCWVAGVLTAFCGPASSSPWMGAGGPVIAPEGFRTLCALHKDRLGFCNPGEVPGPAAVRLDPELRAALERFNRAVNDSISYQRERKRRDDWTVAETGGDCEDIALAKRQALVAAGWPPGALWLAMGEVPGQGAHLVLVLRTRDGDLVFDNRTPALSLWHEARIRWLIREVPGQAAVWRVIPPLG